MRGGRTRVPIPVNVLKAYRSGNKQVFMVYKLYKCDFVKKEIHSQFDIKRGAAVSSVSKQWLEQSRYDLETARAMFDSGRYLYVLFCCQQAVEKTLKAIIVRRTEEFPPRIHQLMRLAEVAGLEVDENKAYFFRELSTYYIQSRYPEEITDLASQVKRQEAQRVLEQTQEVVRWLSAMP